VVRQFYWSSSWQASNTSTLSRFWSIGSTQINWSSSRQRHRKISLSGKHFWRRSSPLLKLWIFLNR
jgi:hypothetical protein